MADPIQTLHEASAVALEAADRLYSLVGVLLEPERPGEAALRAAEYVQEAAHEIRRHALWLRGEADERSSKPPAADAGT